MKYWIVSAVFVLGVAFFTSCDDEETLGFELGDLFTLNYGEETAQEDGNLKVKFADVLEDSRCPQGATCVWAGQVKVKLQLSGSVNQTVELVGPGNSDGVLAKDTVDNFVISLLDVLPYPVVNDSIQKEEYKIELQVDSL